MRVVYAKVYVPGQDQRNKNQIDFGKISLMLVWNLYLSFKIYTADLSSFQFAA